MLHTLGHARSDQCDQREQQRHARTDAHAAFAWTCRPPHDQRLLRSVFCHLRMSQRLSAQIDFDRPKKKPRLGPHCGAPTPTPVPSRISYFVSNRLITSKRAVRSPFDARSKSWLTPKLT